MITLTQPASKKLQDIMIEKGIEDYALRVFVSGGGCSGLSYGMTFAETLEVTDQVLHTDGIKVIADPASMQYLPGVEIDYVDSLMGGGFRIENPNAAQTCSCGSSATEETGSSCQH
ncbi:MAG TPA: iron-sulfur cluster assembly accessory protein [Chloroflexi bacterium]|nr:MAG: hypothetical protein B6243_11500 [Anaerolineaceae bacterium 4572_5.2]HEY85802.1 iron-sulfur cluster assembly accessory protein [Chloroflexota bacterium]